MSQLRSDLLSWGRVHRHPHRVAMPAFADAARRDIDAAVARRDKVLAYGLGRSYGDSCLNDGGTLLVTRALDRFVAFDAQRGEIECEAGVSLAQIIGFLVARPQDEARWFLAVTPGTKFVTVGGAIANDVHGKSHHVSGTFGEHVRSLRLLRSDGSVVTCSPSENTELFRATVGGLGLTGLVVSARLALARVGSHWLVNEDVRYPDLARFFALSQEASEWRYTVAWVDCLARGGMLGRGVFSRARHATVDEAPRAPVQVVDPRRAVPLDAPQWLLNRTSIRTFNAMRWRRFPVTPSGRVVHFDPVLYPLDAIGHWNRLYGARGFYQYQCVLPPPAAVAGMRDLLARIAGSSQSPFLAVLKVFADRPAAGMLSFPMAGTTLALDLPNEGAGTLALMDELDAIVRAAGGRLYPAKDGRMSAADFRRGYPQWEAFARYVDPAFSSSFWRRVTA
jgi:FAD/FMN-containing dehydrogenase